MWRRFKVWLIVLLGGFADSSPESLMNLLLSHLPMAVQRMSMRAVIKVEVDPSFAKPAGSNLGREIRRDEASEWAKLYLKDAGISYRDSDVHLACELIYHLRNKV